MTVLFGIGERGYDRVIKAQAASTTGPITNGEPLDSGTVMFASNNLAHICRESVRNLVQSPGLGSTKASYSNDGALFNTLRDTGFSFGGTNSGFGGVASIPWDPRCAEAFPCHIVCDRKIGGEASPSAAALANIGRITMRSIRYSIDADIDATNSAQSWLVALTTHYNPRQLMDGDYLAFSSGIFAGTGHRIQTGTLSATRPWHPSLLTPWSCRPASYADGAVSVLVLEAYLWFGWKFVGTGTNNAINGLSAWESRIDPA